MYRKTYSENQSPVYFTHVALNEEEARKARYKITYEQIQNQEIFNFSV